MQNQWPRRNDLDDESLDNTSGPLKKIFLFFSGLMILAYWAIGLYLIWAKTVVPNLGPELNIALGVMLLLYGAFRGLRLYRSISNG